MNELESSIIPLLEKKGGCAIKKMSRSNLRPIGRSLKKRSAKSLGLKSFAELTTPSAALRRLRAFLLMPQPPLLFKEGNVSALKQSVNSFTSSQPWATILRRFAAIQNYDSI